MVFSEQSYQKRFYPFENRNQEEENKRVLSFHVTNGHVMFEDTLTIQGKTIIHCLPICATSEDRTHSPVGSARLAF